jgi:hypothetical protein
MTFTKIFILLGVLLLANAYTEENHVLILTAEDFPNILTEFPQILIEFYAPWYISQYKGVDIARS